MGMAFVFVLKVYLMSQNICVNTNIQNSYRHNQNNMGTNQFEGMLARDTWTVSWMSPPTHLPTPCQVLTLHLLGGIGQAVLGWPGHWGQPRRALQGLELVALLTTGVEFFQHFNTQYGLAAVYRITVSSAGSLPQNLKSFCFFFFSCHYIVHGNNT